jgi:hypothetical protein
LDGSIDTMLFTPLVCKAAIITFKSFSHSITRLFVQPDNQSIQ